MTSQVFTLDDSQEGLTLAAALRTFLQGQSWSQVKQLIASRRVKVGGDLCLDPARRLHTGDVLEVLRRPERPPPATEGIVLRHVDEHLVVVEKPAGLNTVRHPVERDWSERRRALAPTLDDLVLKKLARQEGNKGRGPLPRLRIVQRLDKQTSGLVVFARTVSAERGLGKQFHDHTVIRRYLAIIPGYLPPQRIESFLVRDRGDGRRGSTSAAGQGKQAITHIDVVERLPQHTLLACRLETGRTHQIRIHLAEAGHPVCGEEVYQRRPNRQPLPTCAAAPRLALHAAELGFRHPVSGATLHWEMPLPADLQGYLEQLRSVANTQAH